MSNETQAVGLTMVEKIIGRHAGMTVKAGDIVEAKVDVVMLHDVGVPGILQPLKELGATDMSPDVEIVVVPDHFVPAPTVQAAKNIRLTKDFARQHRATLYDVGRGGICHQVMVEKGHVRPGEIILAPDSHATTYGAMGALGTGSGVTDVAIALATGRLWFRVPPTVRINLKGKMAQGVDGKDVALALLQRFGSERLLYYSLEINDCDLHMSDKLCIANMALEMGVKDCLFSVAPGTGKGPYLDADGGLRSDDNALVEEEITILLDEIEPMLACPHQPCNVKPLQEVAGIAIDQAFLGSCTNGRLEDLRIAATILEGKQVHPNVRMIVTPASQVVFQQALREGIIDIFVAAGAEITSPSCGACVGSHQGLLAPGETCISSSNRNFRGRMGSNEADIYLGSPASVAAAAVAGKIIDHREMGVRR